jgi:hypothetical protein
MSNERALEEARDLLTKRMDRLARRLSAITARIRDLNGSLTTADTYTARTCRGRSD